MKIRTRVRLFGLATCLLTLVAAAGGANAAIVDWRQGSGNTGLDFTTSNGTIDGDSIELGLRAIQRNVGTIVPTGSTYAANTGPSATSPTRAWWNFDIHVNYGGIIANLDLLTLSIAAIGGSPPAAVSFDLLSGALRSSIDCHVAGCANPAPTNPDAQGDEDPLHFYQASQNPTFAPWFPAFDFNLPGIYIFTLTAGEDDELIVTEMVVNVGGFPVPEPHTLALFAAATLALAWTRRRRTA